MNMRTTILLFLYLLPAVALADYVQYEFGSYRDKVRLEYTEDTLNFIRLAGGNEFPLCSKDISSKTLPHSLDVFKELGVESWKNNYFVEDRLDGITFSFKVKAVSFDKSVVGHADIAPKGYKKLVKYFNEVLLVNGCDKFI